MRTASTGSQALGGNVSVQNRMYFQGAAFKNRYGRTATEWAPPVTRLLAAGLTVGAGDRCDARFVVQPLAGAALADHGHGYGWIRLLGRENMVESATALEMYRGGCEALR